MKRILAVASAVLPLGVAAYWMVGNRLPLAGKVETQDVENVVGAVEAWDSAVSPVVRGVRFRIKSPSGSEVDTTAYRDRRLLRVLYAGPNNEPPALTDGFSPTVSLRPRAAGTPLDTLARRRVEKTRRAGGTVIRPVRRDSFHGRPARTWTQESALGNAVEHRVVALGDRAVAAIAASVVGRDTARYEQTVAAMLQTLQFTTVEGTTRSAPDERPAKSGGQTIRVSLALLREPRGEPERGCDDIFRVNRSIRVPESTGRRAASVRLEAALRTLFSIDADSVRGSRHFLARTNDTLSLDSASVDDGVARVYLHGTLTGLRGACDHPRGRIQIEETARALPAVDSVVLYRNGRRTDLTPSGRGRG